MSAMRGSACMTAKFESGALAAMRSARSNALASPCPASTTYCETPIARPSLRVVDAAGQHHVGHARGADQARDARRAAAADEEAALAFGQAVERARLGDADVAGRGELEAAADDRAVQHRDDRHAAELDLLERGVPRARMDDAFGDAALGDLGEVEAGAEVIAFAAQDDRARRLGQVDEGRVQLRDERIADGVALLRPVQAHVQHRARRLDVQQVERLQDGGKGSARARLVRGHRIRS